MRAHDMGDETKSEKPKRGQKLPKEYQNTLLKYLATENTCVP